MHASVPQNNENTHTYTHTPHIHTHSLSPTNPSRHAHTDTHAQNWNNANITSGMNEHTHTCTQSRKNVNSRHSFGSSEPSSQSCCPSHFQSRGIQPPTSHLNSSGWQSLGGRDAATQHGTRNDTQRLIASLT